MDKKIILSCAILLALSPNVLPPDELDQYQHDYIEYPPGTIWNYSIYHNQSLAQTFKPSLPTLTRIRLFMCKTGKGIPDLFVTIENNERFCLGTAIKNESEVPDNFSWVEFDFEPDIRVKVNETHAIVCKSYSVSNISCYRIAYGMFTDYDKGCLFISPDIGITWEPKKKEDICFETYGLPEEKPEPDLDCYGTLNWEDVKPGSTVEGTFFVRNIGDTNSELDWEIVEYPQWGTWRFTPSDGYDLTPEDAPIAVRVSVIVPDEKNQNFVGEIKIVNKENASDYSIIQVSLATQKRFSLFALLERFFFF
jgi:hypothetical protein